MKAELDEEFGVMEFPICTFWAESSGFIYKGFHHFQIQKGNGSLVPWTTLFSDQTIQWNV